MVIKLFLIYSELYLMSVETKVYHLAFILETQVSHSYSGSV